MIYVSRIKSNVKGDFDVALGPKTLIVGDNRSGKTRIVNAVELALTGRASDIFGRAVVAADAELRALAPGRAGRVFAEADITAGDQVQGHALWEAGKVGRGVKKAAHNVDVTAGVDPDTAFPLRAVREAVLGSAETSRKFFLSRVAGGVTEKDILARIPESLHIYYRQGIASCLVTASPVDKLLAALEYAKKQERDKIQKAKHVREVGSTLSEGSSPPSDAEIEAARVELVEARSALENIVAANARYMSTEHARTRLVELQLIIKDAREQAQTLVQLVEAADAALSIMPTPTRTDVERDAILTVIALNFHAAVDDEDEAACAACGVRRPRATFASIADQALASLKLVSEQAAVRAQLESTASERRAKLTALVERGRAFVNEENNIRESLKDAATSSEAVDLTPLRARLSRAETALSKVEARRAAGATIRKTEEEAIAAEADAIKWDQTAKATAKAVGELLDAGVAAFVARVQAFLPTGDTFDLRLRDGAREVCQFGLVGVDGALHTALCGAEWARVMVALALACTPAGSKISVVVPEDRDFDPRTLHAVMTALTLAPAQVIITATKAPVGPVAGWTIVNVGS